MQIKQLNHTQNDNFKLKKRPISPLNLNFKPKILPYKNITTLNPKNLNLKLNHHHSFSQNRIKKRSLSIQTNLFRPNSANQNQNIFKQYTNMKNVNLIKQNLQNLQNKIIHPYILQRNSQKIIKNNHRFLFHKEQKSLRTFQKRSQSQKETFLFEDKNSKNNRKFSHRFDRSKYFNYSLNTKQANLKSRLSSQGKTQSNQNLKGSKMKIQNNKNYIFFDEIIPVIKQRNKMPKTAGGFLKKYSAQHLFFMKDQEVYQKQQQILG